MILSDLDDGDHAASAADVSQRGGVVLGGIEVDLDPRLSTARAQMLRHVARRRESTVPSDTRWRDRRRREEAVAGGSSAETASQLHGWCVRARASE